MRKVDKSKKSNIKCEHCAQYLPSRQLCLATKIHKHYWNRCSKFEWADNFEYVVD